MMTNYCELVLKHINDFQKSVITCEGDSTQKKEDPRTPSRKKKVLQSKTSDGVINTPTEVKAVENLKQELLNNILTDSFSQTTIDNIKDRGNASKTSSPFVEAVQQQIENAILASFDSTLAAIISNDTVSTHAFKSSEFFEASISVLNFIATFCSITGDGTLSETLLSRMKQFGDVPVESIRTVICEVLGIWFHHLHNHSSYKKQSAPVRGRKRGQKNTTTIPFLETSSSEDTSSVKQRCIDLAIEILLPRLEDKAQAVRQAALEACKHLFSNNEDNSSTFESTKLPDLELAISFNISHDPHPINRSLSLNCIPISENTIPLIVERLRDAKSSVRVDALNVIRTKCPIELFTDDERSEILQYGLSGRCVDTYTATTKLLCCGWMKTLKYDPSSTIKLFNPVLYEDACISAINAMLATASEDYTLKNDVPFQSILKELSDPEINEFKEKVLTPVRLSKETILDPSSSIYLRMLYKATLDSKSLSPVKQASLLSLMVPDITVLGDVLEHHLDRLYQVSDDLCHNEDEHLFDELEKSEDSESFICIQLMRLAQIVDLNEEGSRRHFTSLVNRILCNPNTSEELIEECVHVLFCTSDSEDFFIDSIEKVLDEILSSSMDCDSSTYVEMSSEQSKFIKYLGILSIAMEKISRDFSLNKALVNFSDPILRSITDTTLGPVVREAGVSCLARYAILLGEDNALSKFKPLLMEIASNKTEKVEIRAQAMMASVDLTLLFHKMLLPIPSTVPNKPDLCIIDLLVDALLDSNKAFVMVAAECAAKLHFAGRLHEPKILAKMLMIYFDESILNVVSDTPSNDIHEVGSPARLQQILSMFFPAYAMKSPVGKKAFIDSTKVLLQLVHDEKTTNSKGTKPSIPLARMLDYICCTCDGAEESNPDGECMSNTIVLVTLHTAEYLIQEHDNLDDVDVRALCKILGKAYIDTSSAAIVDLLRLKKRVEILSSMIIDDTAFDLFQNLVHIIDIDFEADLSVAEFNIENTEGDEGVAGNDIEEEIQASNQESASDDYSHISENDHEISHLSEEVVPTKIDEGVPENDMEEEILAPNEETFTEDSRDISDEDNNNDISHLSENVVVKDLQDCLDIQSSDLIIQTTDHRLSVDLSLKSRHADVSRNESIENSKVKYVHENVDDHITDIENSNSNKECDRDFTNDSRLEAEDEQSLTNELIETLSTNNIDDSDPHQYPEDVTGEIGKEVGGTKNQADGEKRLSFESDVAVTSTSLEVDIDKNKNCDDNEVPNSITCSFDNKDKNFDTETTERPGNAKVKKESRLHKQGESSLVNLSKRNISNKSGSRRQHNQSNAMITDSMIAVLENIKLDDTDSTINSSSLKSSSRATGRGESSLSMLGGSMASSMNNTITKNKSRNNTGGRVLKHNEPLLSSLVGNLGGDKTPGRMIGKSSKRKETTPTDKGRTPSRPRRHLAEMNT